ncbi:MAG: hypothetical protein ACP5TH_02980 [Fervidicoccaceae archaeon]
MKSLQKAAANAFTPERITRTDAEEILIQAIKKRDNNSAFRLMFIISPFLM